MVASSSAAASASSAMVVSADGSSWSPRWALRLLFKMIVLETYKNLLKSNFFFKEVQLFCIAVETSEQYVHVPCTLTGSSVFVY